MSARKPTVIIIDRDPYAPPDADHYINCASEEGCEEAGRQEEAVVSGDVHEGMPLWIIGLLVALAITAIIVVTIVVYWHRHTGSYTTELQFKYNELKAKEKGSLESCTNTGAPNAYENPIYRDTNKDEVVGVSEKQLEVGQLLTGSDESLDAHFAQDTLMYTEQPKVTSADIKPLMYTEQPKPQSKLTVRKTSLI